MLECQSVLFPVLPSRLPGWVVLHGLLFHLVVLLSSSLLWVMLLFPLMVLLGFFLLFWSGAAPFPCNAITRNICNWQN